MNDFTSLLQQGNAWLFIPSAILLGAVVPGIRKETENLAADLKALSSLRVDIAAQTGVLEETAAEARAHGNRVIALLADVSDKAQVQAMIAEAVAQMGAIHAVVNNAGILTTPVRKTEDGLETIVSVNYVAPYMLTRQLLPLMQPGCRIVNTVSCTYAIGRIEPDFFEKGRNGRFFRIPVYSNTKLALLLFTQEFAERLQDKDITINASDPGIVSTNMITMQAWFDPLTDILFRPFIKTPAQGAATAIHLALSDEAKDRNGCCYANCKKRNVSERIRHHAQQKQLWDDTEILLRQKGIRF